MPWSVGVDEAGRGPVIGPLVIGICAVPQDGLDQLKEQGVRDSKDLSAVKRKTLEAWFFDRVRDEGWFGATVVLDAEAVDLALQGEGLNLLEVTGFRNALSLLPQNRNYDIIVDACDVDAQRFGQRITSGLRDWPWDKSSLTSMHKADAQHLVVGMASILAKEERDRLIRAIQQRVGVPIGSGYPSDPTTRQALPVLCPQSGPDPDVRWGWATVRTFWQQHRQGDVPVRGQPRSVQRTLFHG